MSYKPPGTGSVTAGRGILAAAVVLFALAVLPSLKAATLTWTGGAGDGQISSAGNWNPAVAPATGDTLNFGGNTGLAPQLTAGLSLNSLNFNAGAGAFTLGGAGAYTIGAGGIANNSTQLETINNAIALSAAETWSATAGALEFGGNVNNGGFLLSVSGPFNTKISSVVSGTGGLTKTGGGTVTLTGTAANTYTGATTVNTGTLMLAKTAGLNAFGGPLLIGDGLGGGTVRLSASNQINSQPVTINSGGLLDLNNNSDTLGTLTLTGGTIATGTGALTFNGNLATNASNVSSTISGNAVIPGNGSVTVARGTTPSGYDLVVSANVSGGFGFDKLGPGTLLLSGNNTFMGGFTIDAGMVAVTSAQSLGAVTGPLTINAGTLEVVNGFSVARAQTLGSSSSTYLIDPGQTYTLTNVVSGTGTLNKAGTGTLTLTGTNTYTGGTLINAGTVAINSASSLGATTSGLTLNAGTLEVTAGFSTTRAITLNNASSTFQIDPAQTSPSRVRSAGPAP